MPLNTTFAAQAARGRRDQAAVSERNPESQYDPVSEPDHEAGPDVSGEARRARRSPHAERNRENSHDRRDKGHRQFQVEPHQVFGGVESLAAESRDQVAKCGEAQLLRLQVRRRKVIGSLLELERSRPQSDRLDGAVSMEALFSAGLELPFCSSPRGTGDLEDSLEVELLTDQKELDSGERALGGLVVVNVEERILGMCPDLTISEERPNLSFLDLDRFDLANPAA